MRKMFYPALSLIVVLGLVLTFVLPAMAALGTIYVVSDTNVQIIGVYNKADGLSNHVDLSLSDPPVYAALAAEPKPYPTGYANEPLEISNSVWDEGTELYFQNASPVADWIWETARAEDPANYDSDDPLYDSDASSNGRVVVFQKKFFIPGTPQTDATLHIAADNCYEVYINGNLVVRSSTAIAGAGWENSHLHQDSVTSQGWQTEALDYTVPKSFLNANDDNIIKIIAGNEYYPMIHMDSETTNDPCPPYVADDPDTEKNEYSQQNPGALIFKLDVDYDEPVIPPVPELPAGMLLGLGLLGIGGFMIVKKKRKLVAAK
jgi:hypothetical protein